MGSTIRIFGKVRFSNNRALSGTAFIFERNSKLIISDDCYIILHNNHAFHYGGTILVHTEEIQDTSIILSQDIIELNPDVLCMRRVVGWTPDSSSRTTQQDTYILYGGLVALGYELLQRRGNECDSKQL